MTGGLFMKLVGTSRAFLLYNGHIKRFILRKIMSGYVTGNIRLLLRLEGLGVLVVALMCYSAQSFDWSTFAWFFLLPDISFAGYLAGPLIGAISYNTAHSYIGAIICLIIAQFFSLPGFLCAAIIWFAHLGFDRALGYGLKYAEGFGYTHLGRIGDNAPQQ